MALVTTFEMRFAMGWRINLFIFLFPLIATSFLDNCISLSKRCLISLIQAFLDFRDFRYTAVYNSIPFSITKWPRFTRFLLPFFFSRSPHNNSVNRGMLVFRISIDVWVWLRAFNHKSQNLLKVLSKTVLFRNIALIFNLKKPCYLENRVVREPCKQRSVCTC